MNFFRKNNRTNICPVECVAPDFPNSVYLFVKTKAKLFEINRMQITHAKMPPKQWKRADVWILVNNNRLVNYTYNKWVDAFAYIPGFITVPFIPPEEIPPKSLLARN